MFALTEDVKDMALFYYPNKSTPPPHPNLSNNQSAQKAASQPTAIVIKNAGVMLCVPFTKGGL